MLSQAKIEKCLSSENLIELTDNDLRETNGGIIPFVIKAIKFVGYATGGAAVGGGLTYGAYRAAKALDRD